MWYWMFPDIKYYVSEIEAAAYEVGFTLQCGYNNDLDVPLEIVLFSISNNEILYQ